VLPSGPVTRVSLPKGSVKLLVLCVVFGVKGYSFNLAVDASCRRWGRPMCGRRCRCPAIGF